MAGDTSLVVDCPVCFRTVWANSTCRHGLMDLEPVRVDKNPDDAELVEPESPRPSKGPRQRRDKGH